MIDVEELSQAVVLSILQNSNSVPFGAEIWSSPQEFKKLKTIIEYAVAYSNKQKELNDGGEPVKNATYWKRQYNLMATQNDNLKSGLYHANEQIKYLEGQLDVAHQLTKMRLENSAPAVKELTQGEIHAVWAIGSYYTLDKEGNVDEVRFEEFAKAVIKKAREK